MTDTSREMVKLACHALAEKKAEDVRVIDIRDISVIADYFVIASANNTNQMQAFVDAVDEELYKAGYTECSKEGNQKSSWVLMDYKDIIVHLFSKEDRLFYDLERIWKDGKMIDPEDL
ncbi:MAG: ribosome silencing factor [Eubacterium sp.]|nr:ribosome silencing factor [Eubacterium sp.]MBQ9022419.1 ribosome silencing factor [Eubacterium sp.]